eukprot:SAG31_NODE_4670_length_3046_cov_1.967424_3_plen_63_part_00
MNLAVGRVGAVLCLGLELQVLFAPTHFKFQLDERASGWDEHVRLELPGAQQKQLDHAVSCRL